MEKKGKLFGPLSQIKAIANWKDVGRIASIGIATSAIGSTIAILADGIMDWLKGKNLKSKSKEYYKEMLKAHPALQKEDPKLVAQFWASLFHFAPFMAADPLSAGAFIRQSIARGSPEEFGGPPIDTYNTLANINKAFTDTKKSPGIFSGVASSAAEKVMGTAYLELAGLRTT